MAIEISELRPENYDELAALWQSAEGAGPMPFESSEALGRFLRQNRGLSVVAWEDGSIVAAVICKRDGGHGCANTLAVRPDRKDSDLSRRVLDKALRKLGSHGIHRFQIQLHHGDDQRFWGSVRWQDQLDKPAEAAP